MLADQIRSLQMEFEGGKKNRYASMRTYANFTIESPPPQTVRLIIIDPSRPQSWIKQEKFFGILKVRGKC